MLQGCNFLLISLNTKIGWHCLLTFMSYYLSICAFEQCIQKSINTSNNNGIQPKKNYVLAFRRQYQQQKQQQVKGISLKAM